MYRDELTEAMGRIATLTNSVFVGQSVIYGGQAMFPTLKDVPMEKRIEFPVAEDLLMGFCTGLALTGQLPVCIYPRMDFLLLASNQLVNHLDKLYPELRMIIRVAVGSKHPINAGPQHTQDHSFALDNMLENVEIVQLEAPDMIKPCYEEALNRKGSTILVEYTSLYNA